MTSGADAPSGARVEAGPLTPTGAGAGSTSSTPLPPRASGRADGWPPRWTSIAARVPGAWILLGGLGKAFLGSPADLPALIRGVPLALGTTFSLVVGAEVFVGVATLLRPGRAWPLAGAFLLAFLGVLVSQVASGAASCGCFGATISLSPVVTLGIDLVVLALLVVSRPWRLAKGGAVDLAAAVVALALGVSVPLLLDRELKLAPPAPGGPRAAGVPPSPGGVRPFATLDVRSWAKRPIRETTLASVLDLSDAYDGVWIFYRASCEVCAQCLEIMARMEQGEREVTLVLVPETEEPGTAHPVHEIPRGSFVHALTLPGTATWMIHTPARLIVADGIVTEATENVDPATCR